MSLRFYFGGSGSGKSRALYEELIARSLEEPQRNFLLIVPDQFTMQTQKELVMMHPRGGIMNIDILSFGRLSHRILEEVGGGEEPVLDDTGKSLVLRKVAAAKREQLSVLGGNLDKQGYLHEVKSAISEFMQYGIGQQELAVLMEQAKEGRRGALAAKLQDLSVLYQGFLEYIEGKFITTEGTLDRLGRNLPKSGIIPGSVIAFDGFTGFTPIQNRIIAKLMELAGEVIVTITLGNDLEEVGEQDLFALSKKTVNTLCKLAKEQQTPRGKDVWKDFSGEQHRFKDAPALSHLEQHLFRFPSVPFPDAQRNIRIFEASDWKQEVRQAGILLEKMVRTEDYYYRDFGVICGDLESYADVIRSQFEELGIPIYLDCTKGIVLNPFIESIRSIFGVFEKNFSYRQVFQYLRSGMTDFTTEEVDRLEDYVIQCGIRGRKNYERIFAKVPGGRKDDLDYLLEINSLREKLMDSLSPFLALSSKEKVSAYVMALYTFLEKMKGAEKLAVYEQNFLQQGNLTDAKEYGQIYRLVMELLEQMMDLLGEEEMPLQEFGEILDAGFGEIQVGTIPQNVDRVLIGDMERTRLKQVKVLFFLGVNDGNIPRSGGKGGIISDIDREFLEQGEVAMAPSPRAQMYIQRLYLYLNLTKPSQKLLISYARVTGEGKTLRPAYLIDFLKKMFPLLQVEHPQKLPKEQQILTPRSGMAYLAEELREYAGGFGWDADLGEEDWEDQADFFALIEAYKSLDTSNYPREYNFLENLIQAAFLSYEKKGLSKEVARALYGQVLFGSVSRLETFASCACKHFLQYGLALQERQEYGFEPVDMGNVFHSVLENFGEKLENAGYTWFNFPGDFGERTVGEALEAVAAEYGATVLYANARNAYMVERMKRVLHRTVSTIQYQLRKGSFVPGSYELQFDQVEDLDSINIALSGEEKMKLRGKVDRIDLCQSQDKLYVKVVDYKSGEKTFDLVAVYRGLQLQLVVYMNAAVEMERKKHPDMDVVPAAMLYYHVADPMIEAEQPLTPEEINQRLLHSLRTEGVILGRDDVVDRLDGELETKSDVIPVERKKDGTFSARSSLFSEEEMEQVSAFVQRKVKQLGQEILQGDVQVNPYHEGARDACTYCQFHGVCGFDAGIPGYRKRTLKNMSKIDAMAEIAKEVAEDGHEIHT